MSSWYVGDKPTASREMISLTQASFPSLLSLTLGCGSAVLPQPPKRRDSTWGESNTRSPLEVDHEERLRSASSRTCTREFGERRQSRSRCQFRQLPQFFHPHLNVLDLFGAPSTSGKHPGPFKSPYTKQGGLVKYLENAEPHFQVNLLRVIDDVGFWTACLHERGVLPSDLEVRWCARAPIS